MYPPDPMWVRVRGRVTSSVGDLSEKAGNMMVVIIRLGVP